MNKLIGFAISYVIKLEFLDGYRSYIAGAGMTLTGVGLIANQVATGVYDYDTMEKGVGLVLAGLAVLGHAGKQEKLLDVVVKKDESK
jgi:hypothetical protein